MAGLYITCWEGHLTGLGIMVWDSGLVLLGYCAGTISGRLGQYTNCNGLGQWTGE